MTNRKVSVVHLYVLQGMELACRDLTSESDPYLYVKCGDFVFNDRENYKLDDPDPEFN